jgi:hypothetical protein
MINFKKLWKVWSHFQPLANICLYSDKFENYLVHQFSDSTCLINDKSVFGPSQIFGIFGLTFELEIRR